MTVGGGGRRDMKMMLVMIITTMQRVTKAGMTGGLVGAVTAEGRRCTRGSIIMILTRGLR